MSEKCFMHHGVENKQLKEQNKKLRKENENEKLETRNENVETKNEKVEKTNEKKQLKKKIKEELKEIKSPNWFDQNKCKKSLAIIDSKEFNYKDKIGEFKYIDIKDLVSNIKNNKISKIVAKRI